jgi:glucose/mannose-6-phosphate isomerase
VTLDDPAALRAADPGGMLDAVVALPDQWREGHRRGRSGSDLPSGDGVTAIVVAGMGSSALVGDVVVALAAPRLRMPVVVVRTPELPELCGPHTFVLASSYSGETAETLALFEEAVRRGCRIVALASGGELVRRAEELDIARVVVPGGLMPRAAFGSMAGGGLGALEAAGLLPNLGDDLEEAIREMRGVLATSGPEIPTAANPAKTLVSSIGHRTPVVWGAEGIGFVAATRWKTQLNENAKVPAFAAAMPELDHNEVVGWSDGRAADVVVIALRHDGEHPDVAARFEPSSEIVREAGGIVLDVWAGGRSPLARLLTLVLTGDLVATYLGIARGVDPSPIDAIARLKRAMAEP